jgi:hypothetical protein
VRLRRRAIRRARERDRCDDDDGASAEGRDHGDVLPRERRTTSRPPRCTRSRLSPLH